MKKTFIFLMTLFLLTACARSNRGVVVAAPPATGTIVVVTVSNVSINLTGTWIADCYGSNSGTDLLEQIIFNGLTVSYTITGYPSTNQTCTGVATPAGGYNATTVVSATNGMLVGWQDGASTPVPNGPTAQGGAGTLGDNALFTNMVQTITSVSGSLVGNVNVGDAINLAYIIDDTGTTPRFYRSRYDSTGNLLTGDTFDALIKK